MPIFRREPDLQSSPQTHVADRARISSPEPVIRREPVTPLVEQQPVTPVPQPTIQPVVREAAAVVDKNSEITGTLHSQGNVLIEGHFEGEIEAAETVWVEKGARTQAQLRANDVIVSGAFQGEIVCEHRLQVSSTATINGEIETPVLVVEDGATVNCRFSMKRAGGRS